MDPEPLTAPAIHRALAALDAGQLPDAATIRAALLLALTVGPLLVERRHLRAIVAALIAPMDLDTPDAPDTRSVLIQHGMWPKAGTLRRARALLEEGQGDG